MKIWIDAQLPPTLARWLSKTFDVETTALRELGLRDAKDVEIFNELRPQPPKAPQESPKTPNNPNPPDLW